MCIQNLKIKLMLKAITVNAVGIKADLHPLNN